MSSCQPTQFITVPADISSTNRSTDTIQIAYNVLTPTDQQAAQKRPALLVRGWQGVKEDWAYVATGLARDRPVVIVCGYCCTVNYIIVHNS